MNDSFDHPGDALKGGYLGRQRTKFIHSVGITGRVQFVPTRNAQHFSGLFRGANYGIIRFSSAAAPNHEGGAPLTPGFGLKFLRDGIDSANLVAMLGVDGQPGEWDFFANDFKNHIAPAKSAALKLLERKFSTATDHIAYVGLSDFGQYGQNG
jgi:hypothetical protein